MSKDFNGKNAYEYIVWDWNGTLYNDVIAGMETVNDMLYERGLKRLDLKRYREIFTFPIIDYYKEAGFDFSIESYDELAAVFIEKNNARLCESGLADNAVGILKSLKKKGYKQVVLSASRQDILIKQMSQFSIMEYFDAILGKADFYAYGKSEIAKEWLARLRINPKNVLIIGDTLHDYEVANALNCDCFLVLGGHQSEEKLRASGQRILKNISEVLDVL